jgi:hypothetical protein
MSVINRDSSGYDDEKLSVSYALFILLYDMIQAIRVKLVIQWCRRRVSCVVGGNVFSSSFI